MKITKERTPYNTVIKKTDSNFLTQSMLLTNKFPDTKFLNTKEIYQELINNNITYIEALFVFNSVGYDNLDEAPLHYLHWAFDVEGVFKLHVLKILLPPEQFKQIENHYNTSFNKYQNTSGSYRRQAMIEYEKVNNIINELFFQYFIKNKNEVFVGKECLVTKEALELFFSSPAKKMLEISNLPHTMSENLIQYNLALLRVLKFTETISKLCDSDNRALTPTYNSFLQLSKDFNLGGGEIETAKKINELVFEDIAKNSLKIKQAKLRIC